MIKQKLLAAAVMHEMTNGYARSIAVEPKTLAADMGEYKPIKQPKHYNQTKRKRK